MNRQRFCLRLFLASAILAWLGGVALANDYRIGRGDTISITVVGYPDLTRKAIVNTAGEVSLPFVGSLAVAGKSVEDVRKSLKAILAEKGVVRGAEVSLEISTYAPVYVNGDVTKPGAYEFRPGMTVRHAIALASGFSTRPEGLSAADLWGQHRAAALAMLKAQARVIRLQAELAGADKIDFTGLGASPSDQALLARVIELETAQFDARKQDRKREVAFLNEMLDLARSQKKSLETQLETEKSNLKALSADYDRVRKAFGRGILPAQRLTDALQAVAQVKARSAGNLSQIVEMRRLETDFERKAQRFSDAERLKILGEVQEAVIEAAVVRARLQVARQKLDKGGVRGQFGNFTEVEIRIFRQGGNGTSADEGTMLQSGDVIEVRMPYDENTSSIHPPVGRALRPE